MYIVDILGARIEQIHNSYGLTRKITATVTDNGSNCVKVFLLFHQASLAIESSSVFVKEAATLSMEEYPDDSLESTDTDEVTFENVDRLLTVDTEGKLIQV